MVHFFEVEPKEYALSQPVTEQKKDYRAGRAVL